MPSPGSSSSGDRTFEVLALDYEMAREDERTFAHIQANVAAIAVALLAAIMAVVSDTCQLSPPTSHPMPPSPYQASTETQCDTVPDLFLAGAPAIPLAALAFLQLLGTAASLRSYYIRAIEKELRSYAPSPLSGLTAVAPIRPASYHGLIIEAVTLRRGWAGYRILALMIMLTTLGVFGGLTLFIANSLGGTYRTFMLLGYGSAFALLVVEVVGATFGARSAFVQVAKKFHARQGGAILQGAAGPPAGRSLVSYLLLPRPEDWIKWIFVPAAYFAATWASQRAMHLGDVALAVLITEYLVYSARYQWNDIRGMAEDALHPQAAARFRLPSTQDKSQMRYIVTSSAVVALARLLMAILLGIRLNQEGWMVSLVVVVFGVAVLYEYLRSTESLSPTGKIAARSLWVVVGAGYTVRFLVGVHTAGVSLVSALAISGAAFVFAFGVMFVLLTWVLEATSYCRAETAQLWYASGPLLQKSHLWLLLRDIPDPRVDRGPDPNPGWPSVVSCEEKAVLRNGWRPLLAPWNIAYWCACMVGAVLAPNLTPDSADAGVMPWLFVASTVGALIVSRVGYWVNRAVIGGLWVTALYVAAMAWTSLNITAHTSVLTVCPWALATVTYFAFRQQSYSGLKKFGQLTKHLMRRIKEGPRKIVKKLIGHQTWTAMR